MVTLPFKTHSVAQPDQAFLVGPFGVVNLDMSSMFENIFTEGDTPLHMLCIRGS